MSRGKKDISIRDRKNKKTRQERKTITENKQTDQPKDKNGSKRVDEQKFRGA
jgi:hypothetical protein